MYMTCTVLHVFGNVHVHVSGNVHDMYCIYMYLVIHVHIHVVHVHVSGNVHLYNIIYKSVPFQGLRLSIGYLHQYFTFCIELELCFT